MPTWFTPKHRSHVSASRFTHKALVVRLKKLQARERALLGRAGRRQTTEEVT